MLTATNLIKKYDKLTVLNGVNLNINTGEFISIVGASGAGKSTLLHLLGCLEHADAGEIILQNTKFSDLSAKKQAGFRNKEMGFVFQAHYLLPEFTALENVAMPLLIGGKSSKEANILAEKILTRVGLSHRLHHKPNQLSGGEQQRVSIARAVVHTPKIIFADEPTGNLDTQNAAAVHQLFIDLQKELKLTIVIVTHNEILANLANRKLTMKDGQIVTSENIRKL